MRQRLKYQQNAICPMLYKQMLLGLGDFLAGDLDSAQLVAIKPFSTFPTGDLFLRHINNKPNLGLASTNKAANGLAKDEQLFFTYQTIAFLDSSPLVADCR